MLQPQPIATEADTGINAFNLGKPFFANVIVGILIIMGFGFLGIFECLTYKCCRPLISELEAGSFLGVFTS